MKCLEEQILKQDKSGMLELLKGFPDQCRSAMSLLPGSPVPGRYSDARTVVLAGMGGSAICGDMLRDSFSGVMRVPMVVLRDYGAPEFVDEKTLFIAVSYSGNTEETISAYKDAVRRSAMVLAVSGGGALERLSAEHNTPLIKIPGGMPPRTALGYMFFPLLAQFGKLGYAQDAKKEAEETVGLLLKIRDRLLEDGNDACRLALWLRGKIPVLYGSPSTASAVLRWRTQLNENSKTLALSAVLPEMNHNEIVGWNLPEIFVKNAGIIFLRDENENERIKKRMAITKTLLEDVSPAIEEVWAEGGGSVARLLSLAYFGDFLSFYLAVLNGVDPTPVNRIDVLKRRLGGL